MHTSMDLDRCFTFIGCQLKPHGTEPVPQPQPAPHRLAVTLSRQTGSGAWLIANRLSELLEQKLPAEGCHWTVFDRELVEKVLADHNLPQKLAQFMPEDRVSAIDDMMQELLGLHPPSWTLVAQTTETILKLAELGNVILIGRGANVVTARLEHVYHVRLVGSLECRVERVRQRFQFDPKTARAFIEKADRGRQRYLKEHFKTDIDNPLLYDLVINTDRQDPETAAALIGEALCRRAAALASARK